MSFVIVGKVKGTPDRYLGLRGENNQDWWSDSLKDSHWFNTKVEAETHLDFIRRTMDIHHGIDSKTNRPLVDSKGQPMKRIDIPWLIYKLLGFGPKDQRGYKPRGEGDFILCEIRLDPIEFFSVKGENPAE